MAKWSDKWAARAYLATPAGQAAAAAAYEQWDNQPRQIRGWSYPAVWIEGGCHPYIGLVATLNAPVGAIEILPPYSGYDRRARETYHLAA